MEPIVSNLDDKIYSNNNDNLSEIIEQMQTIINISNDNLIIKRLSDIITKINNTINDNKKNTLLITTYIKNLQNQIE